MEKRMATTIMRKLKKEFNLDFTRSDYGNYCRSCGKFSSAKAEQEWENATTYCYFIYFVSGMNHYEKFNKLDSFYLTYNFSDDVHEEYQIVLKICEWLNKELEPIGWEVIVPKNTTECILIQNTTINE